MVGVWQDDQFGPRLADECLAIRTEMVFEFISPTILLAVNHEDAGASLEHRGKTLSNVAGQTTRQLSTCVLVLWVVGMTRASCAL